MLSDVFRTMQHSASAAVLSLSLGLTLSAISVDALCAPGKSPPTSARSSQTTITQVDRAAAQALFEQGRALMDQGDLEAACSRFEESDRLEAGLGTRYHLADCYEKVGKTASAHATFLKVAERARDLGQKSREEVARERARAVESKLVRLRIAVPQGGHDELYIERDGSRVGRAQWGLAVPVDPGVHRIRAMGPGLVTWQTEVKVSPATGIASVTVPPLMRDESSSFWAPTSRRIGLAALGVGLASLGVSTAFALRAQSKKEDSYQAGCSDHQCTSERGKDLRDAALSAGNRATWALGVGASGVAAGTVLFFWAPIRDDDSEIDSMRVSPVAHARGGGLRVDGSF